MTARGSNLPRFFPPPMLASGTRPLLVGGELSVEWLLDAYSHGIFPWPTSNGVLTWWSPDPRGIIEFDEFHISRRLLRTIRSQRFRVTCNQAFAHVMRGCGTAQDRCDGTWITPQMVAAYVRLHQLGMAASVECWLENRLVGGVYGVTLGGLFAAESMFYLERDASKVALAHLVNHLRSRGFTLLDIQMVTSHTATLGATHIRRNVYLKRLQDALQRPCSFGSELEPWDAAGQ